mgnify:CR=1 FL=1
MDKMDKIDSTVKDNHRQMIKQLNTLSYFYDQHYNLDCRDVYLGQRLSFSWDIFTNKMQIRLRKKKNF